MIPTPKARRATRTTRLAAAAALAAGLLAACGGGTSTVDAFVPGRILVFGDELNVLTTDGRKYTTNSVDENDVLQCKANPIWVQVLAAQYGMVFAECNPDAVANPKAKMLAAAGATTDELATQIRTFSSGDSIETDDMATVLVGMNDVLQAYASYPAESEDVLIARVEAAGERAAAQVNELAAAGARVLVATSPDMGQTPFAKAESLEKGDVAAAVLSRLSAAFNRSLRLSLTNDGSKIGLLLMDDLMHGMVRVPAAYGMVNTDTAVCAAEAPLPDCNNNTLITADPTPTVSSYLWADATHPTAVVHNYLGVQAITRARNNPF
ncbi:SGNH/GDSL hydrolase family protein [Ideonella sp.]|uniref:SGNH/GDSL hydrolase family protein n=1 Tax=Ideonella sp. TaxID=1929293 RepID=UPI002B49B67E|nr:SGNH/GDSL hydrolase family protein [Ideonella sp.]HJV71813.1 SGNH/GDSL hydrolase family protein [Ideonella sp.]